MTAEPYDGNVVVVGASAGGVEALKVLVAGLPERFPAAVVVVLHLAPSGPSVLAKILDRESALPAVMAVDGTPLEAGMVFVAQADRHLELAGDILRLTTGTAQDHHRPSVDRLFTTAAATLGPRVVGVVLSGALDDGAAGLLAIRLAGGSAIVQDPSDAGYPDMPRNALAAVPDALVLPVQDIADRLLRLCGGTAMAPPG